MSVGAVITKEHISSLKQCKMCKGIFPASKIKMNKCPECLTIYNEWKNGRAKTAEEREKYKGIRAHYNIPSYKKIYSVYQYDQEKFNKIWGRIQKLSFKYGRHIYDNTNPYRVLKLCYVRDEQGGLVHLKDEKHIYRYKALHRINELIANTLREKHNIQTTREALTDLYKETGIIYYNDDIEPTADLETLTLKPLYIRLKVAIRLLRLLNCDDISIKEAVAYASNITRNIPREKIKSIWGVVKFKKTVKHKPPKEETKKDKPEEPQPIKEAKELIIEVKEPIIETKEPIKEPIIEVKEPIIEVKETKEKPKKISKGYLIEKARQKRYARIKRDIVKGLRPCEIYKKHSITDGTYYRLKKELETEMKQNEPRTKQEIQEKLGEIMGIEHYYRLKTLGKITTAIAQELTEKYNLLICDDVINYLYKRTGIRYFKREKMAEITSIYREAVKYRLEVHIALLRLLREGLELEEIIDLIEWQYKISEV